MSRDAAAYRDQLLALQPPGKALPVEVDSDWAKLLHGLAEELARLDVRAQVLPAESDPRTAFELLPDLERVAGLPSGCFTYTQTLQERRAALLQRLGSIGGQSIPFFVGASADLGYPITIDEFMPFEAGHAVAGQPITNDEWVFVWRVNAPEVMVRTFNAGESAAGEALQSWGNELLECVINDMRAAHTHVIFGYGG